MPHIQTALAAIEAVLPPLHDVYKYPDAPSHPEAQQLLAYWQECMAGGGFIMGKHIPSRRIGPLLRNIIIHEPLADGSDLIVRLAGSAVRRRHDWDIKGALLSNMFPRDVFMHHLESSLTAIRTGAPVIIDARIMRGDIEEQRYEALLLPVTAADLTSTWMLAALFFFA